MVATIGFLSSRKGREGRPIIGVIEPAPVICSQVTTNEPSHHSESLTEVQRFEHWLCSERNRWSIDQHRKGGLFAARRFDKRDAERAWVAAIAALADVQGGSQ
jgi:hypothetical protein